MKNILCYGDSNTWGQIAGSMNMTLRLAQRYEYGVRWTSILQQLLGSAYHVIEAGLNGRNTSFDEKDIIRPSRNGLTTLPLIMEMNYPLDLVVFMLGTNDTRIEFNADVERITLGMSELIQCVKTSRFGPNYSAPNLLLIAPTPITQDALTIFKSYLDQSSITKTKQLGVRYKKLAAEQKCYFLDAAPIVKVSADDGIHLTLESQQNLAKAVAREIEEMRL